MSVSRQILPAASDVWSAQCSLHIHVLWLLAATDCFTLQCLTIGQSPVIIRAAQYSNDYSSQNCWYRPVITPPPVHTCAACSSLQTSYCSDNVGAVAPGAGTLHHPPSDLHLSGPKHVSTCRKTNSGLCIDSGYLSPHQIFCGSRWGGECSDTNTARHWAPRQSPAARARKYILQ